MARSLSYKGCSFDIHDLKLTKDPIAMYDRAVDFWQKLALCFSKCIDRCVQGKGRKKCWRQFYSSQQRFFRSLLLSCKVDAVVDMCEQLLKQDKAVVISLWSTGEARTKSAVENADDEGGGDDDVDLDADTESDDDAAEASKSGISPEEYPKFSSSYLMLRHLIETHLPTSTLVRKEVTKEMLAAEAAEEAVRAMDMANRRASRRPQRAASVRTLERVNYKDASDESDWEPSGDEDDDNDETSEEDALTGSESDDSKKPTSSKEPKVRIRETMEEIPELVRSLLVRFALQLTPFEGKAETHFTY